MKTKVCHLLPVILCMLAVAALAVILAAGRGALSIPRSDDWSYLSVTFDWVETGTLMLNGWVHMMFVTQGLSGLFLSMLFGLSTTVLDLSVLFTGLIGLVALVRLSRILLSTPYAVWVVLVASVSPLWLHLSVTFMTDIPAWSLSAVSVALGVSAITKQRATLLILGGAVALWGFGVREYAVVPFLALLVWVLSSRCPKRFRSLSLALGVVIVVVSSAGYSWRQSLPGTVETVTSAPSESLVLYSRMLLTLALLLAPYVALSAVLMWPRRGDLLKSLRAYWLGATVGVLVGAGSVFLSAWQLAGNIIHPYGSSWTSVGDGVRSLPLWGFRAVTLAGILSLVALLALAGMLVQRRVVAKSWKVLERPQVSGSFAGLYLFISVAVMAVYFVAIFVAGAPAFDRYLLLVVPLLGIVILWLATRFLKDPISKWQRSAVAGILLVTGAFGIVVTDGLNQVDGLRWQVASELVEGGVPAYRIDGGDAWFRYHQKDAPGVAQVGSLQNSIPGRTWWQTFFEGSTFCRMVAIESETDLQAKYGPALSIQEERTLLGTPFRIMVFPGPDPC